MELILEEATILATPSDDDGTFPANAPPPAGIGVLSRLVSPAPLRRLPPPPSSPSLCQPGVVFQNLNWFKIFVPVLLFFYCN